MERKRPTFYELMKAAALTGSGSGQKIIKLYIYQGPDGKVYQDANGKVYASKRKGA